MGSMRNRPAGITAVSTFLVTLGAVLCGAVLLALCADLDALSTPAGLRLEAMMLGFFFAGGALAGFGIGLYEGYGWARPASLAAMAFVATLEVFRMTSAGVQQAILNEASLFVLAAGSVLYLSMPAAKRYFSSFKPTAAVKVEVQPAPAIQQAAS